MRTVQGTRRGESPSTPAERYLAVGLGSAFTNKPNIFIVIVGAGFSGPTPTLSVQDLSGHLVDSFNATASDSALPRKYLVLPGWTVSSTNLAYVITIQCASLEDALAIL